MFYKEAFFQETTVGSIPKDWEVAELGDSAIAEIVLGQSPPSSTYNNEGYGLPFLQGKMEFGNIYPLPTSSCSEPAKIAEPNDILLSVRAPVGAVNIAQNRYCIGRGLSAIRPNREKLNHLFLFYYLCSAERRFSSISMGSTFKAIRKNEIERFSIPLPRLPEQKAIAEVLSCVDLTIQKTDVVIAKNERLKKGLIQKLLTEGIGHKEFKDTEIGKIPKEWEVTTIDYECILGTGGTPSRTNPQYYGGKIPWVKSTEVDYCIIRETEETLTEYGLQNSNAKIYPTGSLVIALYGQGITRGKCAIFGINAAVNQACAVVQSKGRIYIPFLFYWFQKSYSWIRSLSQGANQSNLNMTIIRSLKFPLPPRLEQEKIAEILTNLDKKLDLERDQRTRIERIKLGLMDLLLTGKVRVKVD